MAKQKQIQYNLLYSAPVYPKYRGVIPFNKKGQVDWAPISNEGIMGIAKEVIEEKKFEFKSELEHADPALYYILQRRGLLDKVGLEGQIRNWKLMSDEELTAFAKNFIEENKIEARNGLKKAYSGLYQVLLHRNLLDSVFGKNQRKWAETGNEELTVHAKRYFEEKKISNRTQLKKADPELYRELIWRRLLDSVLETNFGKWAAIENAELVVLAQRYNEENDVHGRSDLAKKYPGMYSALNKRRLLDQVFEPKGNVEGRRSYHNHAQEIDPNKD